ncbi:FAD/NAD-P-binding domain-containing protein [Hymenopellis radicata]|nr:FAD/NAD-P-binding domain-containing protein [Hymenopellis radicata]
MSVRQAPLSITFAVVGGGIGGLACAYSLARHGHTVHVFERDKAQPQRSGGIRVPPNLTKLLLEWGLDKELEMAMKTRRSDFYHLDTDEHQGYLLWQADVLREAGGDFCTMHWDELYQILYRLSTSAGTKITFGATVTSVAPNDNDRPVLTFADGSTFTADVVVGADGSKSMMREIVNADSFGEPKSGNSESDMTVYTIVVPSEKLMEDPDLRKRVDSPQGQFTLWMSDRKWLLGYPIRKGKEYCIHANWHAEYAERDDTREWADIVPTSSIDFTGCHPMMARVFSLSPDVLRSNYRETHVEDWVDNTGRILLVAEAAHPTIPFTIHGQSLAVEDAVVLGTLFSRLSRWDQIPQLLDGFQELRQERCHYVHASEVSTASVLSMPPGEARQKRDMDLNVSLAQDETWDEGKLLGQWEVIAAVFGYNAREAAEDWWIKWARVCWTTGFPFLMC